MSSNGDGIQVGTSTPIVVDESVPRTWPANSALLAVGVSHEAVGTDLTHAIAAMRQVQREFAELWRAAVVAGDLALAERLVNASHALRRAASLVETRPDIG